MASLYITEFGQALDERGGISDALQMPPLAEQKLAIGAGTIQSAAWNAATKIVRIETDAICSVAFGANPVASVANMRMAANDSLLCRVSPGGKVAVIANT